MPDPSAALLKTTAAVRMATGILFLLFGQYKVVGREFAHDGFPQYLRRYIRGDALAFYRPFLAHLVLPHLVLSHPVLFGYAVGVLEVLIGVSLLVGVWVRPASVLGALFLLNLIFATWWEPGHEIPVWRYFGAELDKIPLLFLCLIFYAAHAGRTWSFDPIPRKRA